MTKEELKSIRREVIDRMSASLQKNGKPDDDIFYYHPNESHIVLSHAFFWMMSKSLVAKIPHNLCFQLLHKYEGEMLAAYLTESEDYSELLSQCNTLYNVFPYAMKEYAKDVKSERLNRKLLSMAMVCCGYGGDINTNAAYDLLDDMDFNRYGKVVCPMMDQILPRLNRMVEEQMKLW